MRARLVILVAAILLVAGFAALNWSEFLRTAPLSFGLSVTEAPLGLILLGILFVTLVVFLISSATSQTQNLLESRQHAKLLQAQRDLADKAEASRFTDLRQHLDTQMRENRQRETMAAAEFEKSIVAGQRELRMQMEQIHRMLAVRLGDDETRIETRADRVRPVTGTIVV